MAKKRNNQQPQQEPVEDTQEPIVEPQLDKEPVKQQEQVNKQTQQPVTKEDTKMDKFDAAIEAALKDDKLVPIANGLKQYVETCFRLPHVDGVTIANANHNLYNILLNTLMDDNKALSRVRLDFINRIFHMESDRYFSILALNRYDHFWAFGPAKKMGYALLIKYMTSMANPNTRKQVAKKMVAEKMSTYLPHGIVGKLETYYKV